MTLIYSNSYDIKQPTNPDSFCDTDGVRHTTSNICQCIGCDSVPPGGSIPLCISQQCEIVIHHVARNGEFMLKILLS